MKIQFILCFVIISQLWLQDSFAEPGNKTTQTGKQLFRENCAGCHEIGKTLTGPDLKDIQEKRTKEWLIRFIRNSSALIQGNDPDAVKIFNDYKQVNMPASNLSDSEIVMILDYIKNYKPTAITGIKKFSPEKSIEKIKFPFIFLVSCILLFIVTLYLLALLVCAKIFQPDCSICAFITQINHKFFNILPLNFYLTLLLLIIISGILSANQYFLRLKETERITKTGKVNFSHQQHYGVYEINCVYCHVAALTQKTANLPTVSHCMKCHHYIKTGENTQETEILKLSRYYEKHVEIKWLKGYRLARHVRFDHALHIVSGGFECIECHDDPENVMIKRGQYSMKWCRDCHEQNYYGSNDVYSLNSKSGKIKNDCILCHY